MRGFVALVLLTLAVLGVVALRWLAEMPDISQLENLRLTGSTTLYSQGGTPIATLAAVDSQNNAGIYRTVVGLSGVSPALVSAVVFSEDKSYYQQYGIDPLRILRAALYDVVNLGQNPQGASTISTQVIKNTLLVRLALQRSLKRKLQDAVLAIQLNRLYSKDEILQMYLNIVPWGGNAIGIAAAARAYFGKSPAELNLAEGLYLAKLIPAPNYYYYHLRIIRNQIKYVLSRMVAAGWISQAQSDAAWRYPLIPKGWAVKYDTNGNLLQATLKDSDARIIPNLAVDIAPRFVYAVRNELVRRFGNERVFGQGGLKVYTTLNLGMQSAAEAAARKAKLPPKAQMALVGLDPQTGAVRAMLGATLGTRGQFNRATQAWRSPGSSIKPFVYGTALENGWTQANTVMDSKLTYPDPTSPGGMYEPHDFTRTFYNRALTIRYAMDQSLNIPAIRTGLAVGLPKIAATLKAADFVVPAHPGPSISIGAVQISPMEMAGSYASFINGGYRVQPYLIQKVEDASGQVIYQATVQKTRLWSPQVTYLIWNMLQGYVYDLGNHSLAGLARIPGRVIGGKTGTSNGARDLWFSGLTPGLSAVIWVGRDDDKPMRYSWGGAPSSSVVNPPIWRDFVEGALRGYSGNLPAVPAGLVQHRINLQTGVPDSKGVEVYFRAKLAPNALAAGSTPLGVSNLVPFDLDTGCPAGPFTPPNRLTWRSLSAGSNVPASCLPTPNPSP